MNLVGRSFGKTAKTADAKLLAAKLTSMYKIPQDIDAADIMLAMAYASFDDQEPSPKAAEILMKVADRQEPGDLGFGLINQVLYYGRASKQYDEIIILYMKQIPRAHHLLARLMGMLGQDYLGAQDRRALTVQDQLMHAYAASAARDELDQKIMAAREAGR